MIPLSAPNFNGNEWKYVKECLDSGWVSSVGKYVDEFEERLQVTTGAKYAVAVMNGTAALHLCLQLCGVEKDDEVLVPALAFVAVANAVSYCNAVPNFLDSEEKIEFHAPGSTSLMAPPLLKWIEYHLGR